MKPTPAPVDKDNGEMEATKLIPTCPDWLSDTAKEEWYRMGKILATEGLLTQLDTVAFAGYCQSYARWQEAEEFLNQYGTVFKTRSGYVQQLPQVSIALKYLDKVNKFYAQYGLTPAKRNSKGKK